MSLSLVKSVIENFVKNNKNDLLTIKGKWGVGKTYFWQHTIKNVSKRGEIAHEHYSYVSLFGIDSLEALKNSIFANKIRATSVGRDSFTSASVLFSDVKKFFKRSEQSPYLRKFSGGLGSEVAFLTVRNSIICFDDIERKSDSINLKDILGLASFLKEQRNCKIVFILNLGTLSEEDLKEFQKYNEKVVDKELEFAPTPDETFSYIFNETYPYFNLIEKSCSILEIKNIRILQRIRRFVEELLPHIKNVEEVVADQVVNSIILFVWSYYNKDSQGKNSESISFEFLEDFWSLNHYLQKEIRKEGISEEVEQKYKLLTDYDYDRTDDVGKELMNFVKKGYLDEKFFEALEIKNQQAIAQGGKNLHLEALKLLRNTFDNNEEDFVEMLLLSFDKSNYKYLTPQELHNAVATLRSLKKDKSADYLIDEYVPKMISYETLKEMKRLPDFENIKDERFLQKLNEIPKPEISYNFSEATERLALERRRFGEEVIFLSSCKEEDYYNFLKSLKDENVYHPAKFLLEFGEVPNPTEEQKIIFEKTKKTLIKISKESQINHYRVSWLAKEIGGDFKKEENE